MSVSCVGQGSGDFPQYGQGCEIGLAAWVGVGALTARSDANARGATGYYRPEDLHTDPTFEDPGVRFCWTNTGEEDTGDYAEVVCAADSNPSPTNPNHWTDGRTGFIYLADGGTAKANVTTVALNRFIEGDQRFNSFDNLDFQPHTGNVYVIEDHTFGEVFACLPDGDDRDIKSDGCVSILSVVDPLAEPTGFIFDASGETAYVVIQHGETPAALGQTDDLLKITGFKVDNQKHFHWNGGFHPAAHWEGYSFSKADVSNRYSR
jgi:secreted PhoX family phosphatase